MKNSTAFRLYSCLSTKETKDFRLFLASPYFNRRDDVIQLEALFHQFVKKKKEVSKNEVWLSIYDNKAFSDVHYRHLFSYMKKMLELFLVIEVQKNDQAQYQQYLISTLGKRGLDYFFEKEISNAQSQLQKQSNRSSAHHWNMYNMYQESYQFMHLNRRQGDMPLIPQIGHLTLFYVIEALRNANIVHTYLKLGSEENPVFLIKEICRAVEEEKFKDESAVLLYYYLYQAILNPQEDVHFEDAKKVLIEKQSRFGEEEIRDAYILAINHCIRKINQGREKYKDEALQLYKVGLTQKTLLVNGVLSDFTYKNIAVLGISLEEFGWVNEFLVEYKSQLDAKTRVNTFSYTMALVHYTKKEYDEAMNHLRTVTYSDILNNLSARRMMMRIYYETDALKALDSSIDSFQAYIRRQKDIGPYRESYQRLLKFMRKIVRVNPYDPEKKSLLLTEIKESQAFPEREWMLYVMQQ